MLDGSQPVGDGEDGFPLCQSGQSLLDQVFILRVYTGGRFIKDDDRGVLQNGPSDGEALLLPAGQPAAVFAAQIILPALGDQRRQTGELDGPIDLCRWELTEHCDIIPDRSVKNKDILLDHRNNVI